MNKLSDFEYSIVSGKLYLRGKLYIGVRWGKYLGVECEGKTHAMHRFVWFLITGEWPKDDIDHVNRDKHCNAWVNLREATRAENCQNRIENCNNLLKVKGVRQLPSGNYDARITLEGITYQLGTFGSIEEARNARRQAEKDLFTHAI